jgi:putative ABC transport system permease protein
VKLFLLELKEGLGIAWDSILANRLRSGLATLGIIIGVATVTLMGTAIDTIDTAFHKSISFIGTDVLYVNRIGWVAGSDVDWAKMLRRRDISLDQVRAVTRQLSIAKAIAPEYDLGQTVKYRDRSADNVRIVGTTAEWLTVGGVSVAEGRFMSEDDGERGRPVCVIGNDVATNLFLLESPLGKEIKIGPRKLEVIGVLDKRGSFMGLISLDNQIIIPVPQLLSSFMRNPDFTIEVKAPSMEQLDDTEAELRGVMRKARRLAPGDPDDFTINRQEQFVDNFNRVVGSIAAVGLLITSLALFVGGIGIMNIMFVSVAERTREIGVRKAIGARRRTILVQFLIEAATICVLGGAAGLGITALAAWLISALLVPMRLSLPVGMLAILVSVVTGLVSGFLPAWRAARMDPVEALRNE